MTGAAGLSPSRLGSIVLDKLRAPGGGPWFVAYSGGLDSTVLLHCLSRVADEAGCRLVALHADHGLSPNGADWRDHCERQCRDWGLECRTTRLNLDTRDERGPEAAARAARYQWFREAAGDGAWLFTAHHRRDQAETVLERLTRGAGPRGLRGMRPVSRRHGLTIARPLLDIPHAEIREYAEHYALEWVHDESNADLRLTRNYIRRKVLPVFAERWPDIETILATTAGAMAEAQSVLDQCAAADLEGVDDRAVRGDRSLSVPALRALDAARQRNVLRYWLHRELGVLPGLRRLSRVQQALERHPAPSGGMTWPPIDLRLYRERLYLIKRERELHLTLAWALEDDLKIEDGLLLRPRSTTGRGLKADTVREGVTVTFRRGGEKCRLPGRPHRHTLKHVLQEAGVPPWQRQRIPLVTIGGEIAAIGGIEYCDPFAAGAGESGIEIEVIHG